jgi:tetrahydromethanopterin S-methyltransferase subunit G
VYNKTNSRIEKLENLVDALKTEKHYFVQANRKMAKDIGKIYFKLIFFLYSSTTIKQKSLVFR